jgi:uncharacterized membrane protein YcaP (DUF421 family)
MNGIIGTFNSVLGLGLEAKDLTFVQISLRAIVVFVVSIVMVRVANRRFLSKLSAFDAVLGFILASMLARAVNGTAAFFPTLGGGFVLVGLHALLARLAFRFDKFGSLIKGEAKIILEEGKLVREQMRRAEISEKDILEEARLNGLVRRLEDIQLATLERSGEISVIPRG